jgi:tetratricopeptide (TPR) repeat protein
VHQVVLADPTRAQAELDTALTLDPRNAEVLSTLGSIEQNMGDWQRSLVHLRQATALDPRSPATARRLARALLWLRRPEEARAAAEHAQTLAPTSLDVLEMRAMLHVAQGDLPGARAVLREGGTVPQDELLPYVAVYFDLYWLLDDQAQQALIAMGPASFEDSRADWALVQAEVRHLRGDVAGSHAYADTSRAEFERLLRAAPADAQLHVQHALGLAYLGRGAEALTLAERGLAMTNDGISQPYLRLIYARILVLAGAHDQAIAELERLLAQPMYVTKAWLRLDPAFAPLRDAPAFQRLVAGS